MDDSIVILFDHTNIQGAGLSFQRIVSSLVESVAVAVALPSVLDLKVRTYGGWYEENTTSLERFEAAKYYAEAVPSALKVGARLCRVSFEFADFLAQKPPSGSADPHRITHTVAARRTPARYRLVPGAPPCPRSDCGLKAIRKWLKGGKACPSTGCPHDFAIVFERIEQKQVDVHIAADLIYFASPMSGTRHVALVSDDVDFTPALLAARRQSAFASKTITLIRSQTANAYQATVVTLEGIGLLVVS